MHGFALLCKYVLGHPWALTLLKRCQRIVTAIKQSHKLTAMLAAEMADVASARQLQTSATTRFSSVYFCMRSVLNLQQQLENMVQHNRRDFPKQRGKGEDIRVIIGDRRGFWYPLLELVPFTQAFQQVMLMCLSCIPSQILKPLALLTLTFFCIAGEGACVMVP